MYAYNKLASKLGYTDFFEKNIKWKNSGIQLVYFCIEYQDNIYLFLEGIQRVLDKKGINILKKTRSSQQRLENYLQISKGLKTLHESNIVHYNLQPSKIVSLNDHFEELKIGSLENSVINGNYGTDHYSITNPPEINSLNSHKVTFDSDIFQLGMTLAIIEIGEKEFYENIDLDLLNKNYIKRYFN